MFTLFSFCYSVYLPLLTRTFSRFSSRFPRARWSGPWAKEYTSVTWSLTARLPRPLDGHFFAHWESGSVALHTVTWQWTNTNGWSAMNLKASRLNRCALTDGAEWYFTVTSFGHLRENILSHTPYSSTLEAIQAKNLRSNEAKFYRPSTHGLVSLAGKFVKKILHIPFLNKLVLQGIRLILSGRGIASISYDWQLLVTWCHWYLKEQKFAQHHSNREIILRVRTHESLVRKHIQRECKVSFAFITKHQLSVTWFPANRWHDTIFGVETAELYFYFTHACHDILSSHRDFQDCVGVYDSCRCVPASCFTASQRCC